MKLNKTMNEVSSSLITEKTRPDNSDDIKYGYNGMTDSMYELEDAIKKLGDKKLITLMNGIKKAESAFIRHLDKNYDWE
tara:strand:+ start:1358 stop:1594 length:237 start_codon:yes stop_codon:yes gene_type:complete